jgi:hypothetical protein
LRRRQTRPGWRRERWTRNYRRFQPYPEGRQPRWEASQRPMVVRPWWPTRQRLPFSCHCHATSILLYEILKTRSDFHSIEKLSLYVFVLSWTFCCMEKECVLENHNNKIAQSLDSDCKFSLSCLISWEYTSYSCLSQYFV